MAYLGEGPAEEAAEPLPAWPLMVPDADITADIMALMGERSPPPPGAAPPSPVPPPRSPFCSFFSPSIGPMLAAA